jgi:uncharacterized protein
MLHKAIISGLTMDPDSNTPIIILKTEDSEQVIPIWIGLLEATAIASALRGMAFDRPMTHDLLKNVVETLGGTLVKIEVSDIVNDTYYARIHIATELEEIEMDARPSDAVALALRFEAPIYVDDRVIEKSGKKIESVEAADETEEGKKWKEYLEKLNPEKFGKYKI